MHNTYLHTYPTTLHHMYIHLHTSYALSFPTTTRSLTTPYIHTSKHPHHLTSKIQVYPLIYLNLRLLFPVRYHSMRDSGCMYIYIAFMHLFHWETDFPCCHSKGERGSLISAQSDDRSYLIYSLLSRITILTNIHNTPLPLPNLLLTLFPTRAPSSHLLKPPEETPPESQTTKTQRYQISKRHKYKFKDLINKISRDPWR